MSMYVSLTKQTNWPQTLIPSNIRFYMFLNIQLNFSSLKSVYIKAFKLIICVRTTSFTLYYDIKHPFTITFNVLYNLLLHYICCSNACYVSPQMILLGDII